MNFHDPLLQANYLRQCLAHDKRPLGLFIGAGCPMAVRVPGGGSTNKPLIPDIAGITALVDSALRASGHKVAYEKVLSHFHDDSKPAPNIETLLSHLRSLKIVAGKGEARGISASTAETLDDFICGAIEKVASCSLPGSDTPYHKLAAWVGAIERSFSVELFTTNYDLLTEEALEINRVPFFDGFVGSKNTFLDLQAMEGDILPSRWARLWKIHGSLNWFESDDGAMHRGSTSGKRHVIYPSHLKYDESRRMPYLAMLDRLKAFFRQPSAVLVTCGYSFADDHLNEVITQGLQGNPNAAGFALMYGPLNNYEKLISQAQARANLSVLSKDEAIIGTKRLNWPRGRPAASCPQSLAVKWVDDPGVPGTKNAEFLLGDFAAFCAFLEDLVGEKQRTGKIA